MAETHLKKKVGRVVNKAEQHSHWSPLFGGKNAPVPTL